jgi:RimJ/RimL family protein N-acetyltransferase
MSAAREAPEEPRVAPLGASLFDDALLFLDQAPYENVLLAYLLRFETMFRRGAIVAALRDDALEGIAAFTQHVILAGSHAGGSALARAYRPDPQPRMITGQRPAVRGFWEVAQALLPAPRAIRERQIVMVADRASLRLDRVHPEVVVRKAVPHEWRIVAEHSAAMIAGELELPRDAFGPDFEAGIRSSLERGLWWVGEIGGELCFFCNVGPWSARTVQLQGIWTPPALRGRGLATAALARICDRLLSSLPTISLYVNDFNEPALRLYDRVGFRPAGELTTILL